MESIFKALAGATAFSGLIWVFCDRLEKIAGGSLRKATTQWLRGPAGATANRPSAIVGQAATLLDRFFGKRHLSWRCFLRSSAVSLSLVVSGLLIYGLLTGSDVFDLLTESRTTWGLRDARRAASVSAFATATWSGYGGVREKTLSAPATYHSSNWLSVNSPTKTSIP